MLIHIKNSLEPQLLEGLHILQEELGYTLSKDGVCIEVTQRPGNLVVSLEDRQGIIQFEQPVHLYRALGLFLEHARVEDGFNVEETPQFRTSGAMVDSSRNAVLSIDSIKRLIRIMATMGLNQLMLYTEDTYEIPTRPYFGYLRGRYTYDEIKACDDYAAIFGIEMVACIQTLGHLRQALQWQHTDEYKDTEDILLIGSEETYQFIDEMIQAATAPLRSKRIHIGMDEAHTLGLGNYIKKNGYRPRFELMNEHLHRVLQITAKYDLNPMIWSDMYFRLGSVEGDYYDTNSVVPDHVIADMPKEMQYVYWDYYHSDPAFYKDYIQKHQKFGSSPIFAGGAWTWNGIIPNHGKAFRTTNAALAVCKEEGVTEVIATMWGDNGNEGNIFSGLPALQLYAEHAYAKELDEQKLKQRFRTCTGGEWDHFIEAKYIDELPGTPADNLIEANPSRYLLWQDLLLGLFDKHVEGRNLPKHYADMVAHMQAYAKNNPKWSMLFLVYEKLCAVLSIKSDIGIRIKNGYELQDRKELYRIANVELAQLMTSVKELHEAHRAQWTATYKIFGWEIIDLRYGGLLARIVSAQQRLLAYVSEEISNMEELETDKLSFDGGASWVDDQLGFCNLYHRMISTSTTLL